MEGRSVLRALGPLVIAVTAACRREVPAPPRATAAAPPPSAPALVSADPPRASERRAITLIAGGDISFGRLVGQLLIAEPERDFFKAIRPWLDAADVRFGNLEGPLSDQRGETQKPGQQLVFTGPPEGVAALARARFTVVSTANNHAWDYGEAALRETMDRLGAAGVRHVGTGADRASSRAPVIVEIEGFRLGFLAVTDIWNQGSLARHPADPMVARADPTELVSAVRALRESGAADAIVVSYHGGEEYTDHPIPRAAAMLRAAIDAGADVVLGHHPHVVQGVEWHRGKPILYSLGNLLMRMHRDHKWTELGYLARVELSRTAPPAVWACPFRVHGVDVLPLAGDRDRAPYERMFFDHLTAISAPFGGVTVAPPAADGCARLTARAPR